MALVALARPRFGVPSGDPVPRAGRPGRDARRLTDQDAAGSRRAEPASCVRPRRFDPTSLTSRNAMSLPGLSTRRSTARTSVACAEICPRPCAPAASPAQHPPCPSGQHDDDRPATGGGGRPSGCRALGRRVSGLAHRSRPPPWFAVGTLPTPAAERIPSEGDKRVPHQHLRRSLRHEERCEEESLVHVAVPAQRP